MSERVLFKLSLAPRPFEEGGESGSETLLSTELSGGSLLDEELYATTAVGIAVQRGFYYSVKHHRVHTELGAGWGSHEIELILLGGATSAVMQVLVEEMWTALRRLSSEIAKKRGALSDAEIVQGLVDSAVAYASARVKDDVPKFMSIEKDPTGAMVKLTTATHTIRVQFDESGKVIGMTRRKRPGRHDPA